MLRALFDIKAAALVGSQASRINFLSALFTATNNSNNNKKQPSFL